MISILAVVVLYKTDSQESSSVRTLRRELGSNTSAGIRYRVLLIDNSPGSAPASEPLRGEEYVNFPDNPGLANAYNLALNKAISEGFEWLLLLDQDSSLAPGFLDGMLEAVRAVEADSSIAGVLPRVTSGSRVLSPYRFRYGALPEWFSAGYNGVPERHTFAINSGSLLRATALRQVGGFDPRFWLDGADHAIFHALHQFGKRMYVAGNVSLEHDLSVLSPSAPVSASRYRNMLTAESAFWDLYGTRAARAARTGLLAVRGARQLLRRDQRLAKLTLQHLAYRVVTRRRRRIVDWQREYPPRTGTVTLAQSRCPHVSVCMATYNNELYIEEQLRSVMHQLGAFDELVVVDDGSRDRTVQIIEQMRDPRIRIVRHTRNQGVVATFEHAVRCATGDILFLCDGDDIWAENKVREVLNAFAKDPDAQVVCTGIRLIDAKGAPLGEGSYLRGREFTDSLWKNLVRNRFQGSAMSVRASLLRQVLPFPKHRSFLHDAWIGACNTLTGGRTAYIAEPLLLYRRHGNNVSQPLQLRSRITKRAEIALALGLYWLKQLVGAK